MSYANLNHWVRRDVHEAEVERLREETPEPPRYCPDCGGVLSPDWPALRDLEAKVERLREAIRQMDEIAQHNTVKHIAREALSDSPPADITERDS